MTQMVYAEDYSCILDPVEGRGGLYIGNLQAAQNITNLKRLQIKAVLTAAKGVELGHSRTDIPYFLYIPADDHESFDIGKFFHQASNYINDCLQRTSIMIHCLAGVSRSVSLVLAYFIKHQGYSYTKAFELVKNRRRIIHPNDGFIEQLKKFEVELHAHEAKSLSSSPSKRLLQRENSLSSSPTKKYVPSPQIEAIMTKYESYRALVFNSVKKNPQSVLQLKKVDSDSTQNTLSPEKSKFRGKRVASMNVEVSDFLEGKNELKDSRNQIGSYSRRRIGSEYNPLESIQNKQSQVGMGVSELDKKIQEIRRKYQQYQTGSVTNYGRYSAGVVLDENTARVKPPGSTFDRDYMRFIKQRRELVGEIGGARLRRPPSFQQY